MVVTVLFRKHRVSNLCHLEPTFQFEMAEEEEMQSLSEGGGDDQEYYSMFNIRRDAHVEEIKRAYRRLCKIYHPDRYQDEQKQKTAAELFSRIQEAYKVLTDSRLREIYDRRGKAGLAEDMAIVERMSIPSELLEEYEKLRELWEKRTYIEKCCPSGDYKLQFDATSAVDGGIYNDYEDPIENESLVRFTGFSFSQAVSGAITKSDVCTITGYGNAKTPATEQQGFCSSGLILALKHMLPGRNHVTLSAVAQDDPALQVEVRHGLGWGIYGTLQSSLVFQSGDVRLGGRCCLEKNLSDSTTGYITYGSSSSSFKVVHQHSSTVSYSGEVLASEDEGFLKGTVLYHPIPRYFFRAGLKIGTEGVDFNYGITHEIANLTTVGATVFVNPNTGVYVKLKLSRAFMNFSVKVKLSNFVGLAAILYAMSVPLALYGCIKAIALAPQIQQGWMDEGENKAEKSKEVAEKKARAESAIELMRESYERIVTTEQARHGLLIKEAWYGKLFDQCQPGDDQSGAKVIDVHIPLQCMVIDSKLILHESSKVEIHGFYDPCVGEKKFLRVRYEFRGMPHEVTVENSEPLIIPRASHKLENS